MTWKCPYCGYENSDDANFCIRCGAKKPENIAVQSPTPQQQVVQEQQQAQVQQAVETPQPQTVITQPQVTEVQPQQPTVEVQQQPVSQQAPSVSAANKYYIIFITTPASALNKSKVPLDFDVFNSISIGRSPENVIVVPDPEVSRRHAILSLENGKLYIEDLNSTNGTYLYDGKLFNPIKGKIEIQPGSLIKLGNSTIIKIVTE